MADAAEDREMREPVPLPHLNGEVPILHLYHGRALSMSLLRST
jgi:hypothetical protein